MKESQVVPERSVEVRREVKIQSRREILLRIARNRFGEQVTDEDRQLIASQNDDSILGEMVGDAFDAETYEAFRDVLRRRPGADAIPPP
jgi:hypothetical protein